MTSLTRPSLTLVAALAASCAAFAPPTELTPRQKLIVEDGAFIEAQFAPAIDALFSLDWTVVEAEALREQVEILLDIREKTRNADPQLRVEMVEGGRADQLVTAYKTIKAIYLSYLDRRQLTADPELVELDMRVTEAYGRLLAEARNPDRAYRVGSLDAVVVQALSLYRLYEEAKQAATGSGDGDWQEVETLNGEAAKPVFDPEG